VTARLAAIRERRRQRSLVAALAKTMPGPLVIMRPDRTLRDDFAEVALRCELAQDKQNAYVEDESLRGLAEWAYDVADAMLKARAQ
jgi:hypothetical protein